MTFNPTSASTPCSAVSAAFSSAALPARPIACRHRRSREILCSYKSKGKGIQFDGNASLLAPGPKLGARQFDSFSAHPGNACCLVTIVPWTSDHKIPLEREECRASSLGSDLAGQKPAFPCNPTACLAPHFLSEGYFVHLKRVIHRPQYAFPGRAVAPA